MKSRNWAGQPPWCSKKACQYLQHRRDTFLTDLYETLFAAVESDRVKLLFMYLIVCDQGCPRK